MPDFLLEIGCEEIPARMVAGAEANLMRQLNVAFIREQLIFVPPDPRAKYGVGTYSTPRRLVAYAPQIQGVQPDVEEQIQGPAVKIAFKDGKPTSAAEAFAKKAGVRVEKLEKVTTAKGEYLSAHVVRKGRKASEILAELLPKEIAEIYWPKNMYWRAGAPERFVRPIRWIVAMLDGEVIPLEFAGVRAGNKSRGHRFFANEIKIQSPASYKDELAKAKVIVDRAEREQRIRKALDAATRTVAGARWREDKALLDTVVNLTEWPSVILGGFAKEYLALPEEVLVTVMRDHQKYFAIEDASGKLAPHFLAVLNAEGDPEGMIRHGNERVLRARFNDARFFWQTDQKTPLKQRIEMLKAVTFQKDLGSYYEKTVRVEKLAKKIGEDLNDEGASVNLEALSDAAWLAKTDLTTELVKEFTELQGVVGGLYARAQGLSEPVAQAIYDHYKPESMEDDVPRTIEGVVLSIADKADSIAGMFVLGLQPTGSKDPFALRRQANGIVKTIAEKQLTLLLTQLFTQAREGYRGAEVEKKFKPESEIKPAMAGFFRERLEFYLRDAKGFAYDEVNAVLAAGADDGADALERASALHKMRTSQKSGDLEAVCISFKRIKNILRQAQEKKAVVPKQVDEKALSDDAEKALWSDTIKLGGEYKTAMERKNYDHAISYAASLRPALDRFFDDVMVMVDDERIRGNRLSLLKQLLGDFSSIADFSEIVTEGKQQ